MIGGNFPLIALLSVKGYIMTIFINVADLKDPDDPQGRSYREVNREKNHEIPLGSLVELESGARVFVVKHTRDCDETPLYSLGIDPDPEQHKFFTSNGYGEESLTQITSR